MASNALLEYVVYFLSGLLEDSEISRVQLK